MSYEWDDAKATSNYANHGVTFEYASRVFWQDARRVTVEDNRRDYGEKRLTAFGEIEGRVYVVSFTRRGDIIRIISARKGNKREQKKYYTLRAGS